MYTRIYILRFPKDIIDQPIICNLVKEYGVDFNILQASISLQDEGLMVIELMGTKASIKKGVSYLKKIGVKIEKLAASIRRDDDKCYQCGMCTGICPTGALFIHRPDMAVLFDPKKCTGCSLCVTVCPVRAMEVSINRTVSAVGT
ncbi:MAG: 4Fe-4S binding protein [Desulfobulbaceae bacterium]|nr:4Fe-4S binding protein [Desulfobulbaceae bacterium]